MEPAVIDDLNNRVFVQIGERLEARGKTLKKRLSYTRRSLPKRLRRAGQVLVEAQEMAQHPIMARRIDEAPVRKAYRAFERYLSEIDVAAERSRKRYYLAAGLAGQVLTVLIAFVGVLAWRGYV